MTTKTKPAKKAKAPAKKAKAAAKPAATETKEPRVTKQSRMIELMSRPNGATLAELMEVGPMQEHSVRGFISGSVKKKLGHTVELIKEKDKPSRYKIVA